MVCLQFLFGIFIVVSSVLFSDDMVCLQRFFVFVLVLFFFFIVNFTNLSWKEFNKILIISIY